MARIGIYGGSFNPPHLGHILAAKEFQRALELDLLLMVPAAVPPHKTLAADSPASADRLRMVQLAVQDLSFARADDLELRRTGASYTVDTLRELREQYPHDQLFLCMGTDMFESFADWYRPQEICSMATIVMAHRVAQDPEALSRQAEAFREKFGCAPVLIPNDFIEISSSTVRRLLILGGAEDFLQPQVLEYIRSHGLYGTGRNRKNLPYDQLRTESLSLHLPKRVPHVIGCSETAVELAKVHGANVEDAARAGILHDITKALSGREQLRLCRIYGMITDDFEREYTKLLHAPTGAAVAKYVFGENDAVVEAIRWHTSGRAGMSTLEKIIYVADYMEPNRSFPGVEELRRLAFEDLDAAMRMGLEMTMEHLRNQGQPMGRASIEALEDLK